MRVTFLGTGAPMSYTRATLGLLVEAPGAEPLLIDSCSGFEVIRRLKRVRELAGLKQVIVSHRHGDHIGGMPALMMGISSLHIYGHEDALSGVRKLMRAAYPELAQVLDVNPIYHRVQADEVIRLGSFEASFFEVEHRVPTLAVRLRYGAKVLAYSADSLPCEGLGRCALNADLFICDALCAEMDGPDAAESARRLMHPTAREAGEMAQRAGVKRLALVHLARYSDTARVQEEAEAAFGGPVFIPNDLDSLTL